MSLQNFLPTFIHNLLSNDSHLPSPTHFLIPSFLLVSLDLLVVVVVIVIVVQQRRLKAARRLTGLGARRERGGGGWHHSSPSLLALACGGRQVRAVEELGEQDEVAKVHGDRELDVHRRDMAGPAGNLDE